MPYEYAARLVRVIDGDTVELDVDLGFHVTVREKFRLYGIDAPEMRQEGGGKAKHALEYYLTLDSQLVARTIKDKQGKYGRYLVVLMADVLNVNDQMVAEGYAKKI